MWDFHFAVMTQVQFLFAKILVENWELPHLHTAGDMHRRRSSRDLTKVQLLTAAIKMEVGLVFLWTAEEAL